MPARAAQYTTFFEAAWELAGRDSHVDPPRAAPSGPGDPDRLIALWGWATVTPVAVGPSATGGEKARPIPMPLGVRGRA